MEWFKFYGKDFRVDPKVRKLSPVHQLMFVYLLCHASDTDDGIIEYLTEWQLASYCGITETSDSAKEVTDFYFVLAELGIIEVCDETITVVKYKERQEMQLTNAERQKRFREKHKESNDSNTPSVTLVTSDKSRVDKKRIDKSSNIDHQKTFETFWKTYPRKIAKVKAKDMWKRKNLGAIVDKIVAFVEQAKKTDQWSQTQYIPHPTTFLNQQRWEDDLAGYKSSVTKRGGGATI